MEQSMTLLSAQVHFLDTELALIHIPLELYASFLQPILQLLLPARSSHPASVEDPLTGAEHVRLRRPWASEHPFVNVSLTPVECSVACSRALAHELFLPVLECLGEEARRKVAISHDDYIVIQVDGEGLEAGQRVLELTGPLAMNGISIFFVTTYFSDYILVPSRSRASVISALEARGFAFQESSEAFVNVSSPLLTSSTFRASSAHSHSISSSNPFEAHFSTISRENSNNGINPPPSPPPSSISELESRTFALLARRNIKPTVDPSIRLVQCAGSKDTSMRGDATIIQAARSANGSSPHSSVATNRMHLGLVRSLIRVPRPRFFSVTLTDTEPASLLLERDLLAEFEDAGDEILLGSREDILVPITLDLRELPMESTGIVCGVAGRLVGGAASLPAGPAGEDEDAAAYATRGQSRQYNGSVDDDPVIEMSYLSTARAGTVMVAETVLERAMDALQMKW